MTTKKTLLDVVREYGIFEVKEVLTLTEQKFHDTFSRWISSKPKLLHYVLLGIKAEKMGITKDS